MKSGPQEDYKPKVSNRVAVENPFVLISPQITLCTCEYINRIYNTCSHIVKSVTNALFSMYKSDHKLLLRPIQISWWSIIISNNVQNFISYLFKALIYLFECGNMHTLYFDKSIYYKRDKNY